MIRSQAEIRVEFLASRLPRLAHLLLRVAGDLVQLALYIFMGYLAYRYARRASMLPMPMTGVSEAWTYIPVIIGFADAAVVIVLRFLAGPSQRPGISATQVEV